MATVAVINGTSVNIGFAGTAGGLTITTPAISTLLILQSTDVSRSASNFRVEDEVGNVVTSAWSDPHLKAQLEFIIKSTTLPLVITATTTVGAIAPGDILVIGACQQHPDLVGTTWEVMDSPRVSGSNKDAKKWSCSLEKRAGITAAASAV
jgi:hypothetical protein